MKDDKKDALVLDAAEMQEKIAMLEEQIVHLTGVIEAEIKAKSQSSLVVSENVLTVVETPTETFVFEGANYKFNFNAIWHDGQKIYAKDALENLELLKYFVEEYPNSVTKL